MREQVVNLDNHDDHHSARDKMGQAQVDRILLVWPRPIRSKPRPLARSLDLILMHRHASRLGAHLGIITADDHIVDNAAELGLPVFDSVRDAHLFVWRSRHSLRPTFNPPPTEPPSLEHAREHLAPRNESRVRTGWRLASAAFFTAVGLLAAGILLLLTLPAADVTLAPVNQHLTIQLEVIGDPSVTEPDYPNALVPALTEAAITTAAIEVATTGNADLSTKSAQGTVIFTNLTTQIIRIPAGTAVSTSGGAPIRFATQQDVTLVANRGTITTAPVRAAVAGPKGNVKAALINRVEGTLNQRVAVTNRQPTTGGETITMPSVTRADRSKAHEALLTQLRRTGYTDILASLTPYQFSAMNSAKVQQVTDTNYSHFVDDHSDTLTLEMRATVTASVVNNHDAHQAGLHALQKSLNSDMTLQEHTITFFISNSISHEGTDAITFQVTASAIAIPTIDPASVRNAIRWKSVPKARQQLYATFPLADPPVITITPNWFTRTPWLEWRTNVIFRAAETLTQNENTGG